MIQFFHYSFFLNKLFILVYFVLTARHKNTCTVVHTLRVSVNYAEKSEEKNWAASQVQV